MKKFIFNLIVSVMILSINNIYAQDKRDKETIYLKFNPNCSEKYKINTIRHFTTFYISGVRFVHDNRIKPDTINCKSLEKLRFREPSYLEERRKEMIRNNTIFMIANPFEKVYIIVKQQNVCLRYVVEWEPEWVQE